jgi:regulator of RNase E activity RraA
MLTTAVRKKLGGIVINGAIRDYATIHRQHFPVYAAGITHRGPYKDGPGEVNVTIGVDGMTVLPGDLMIGDEDGVICVPFDAAEETLAAAHTKRAAEQEKVKVNASDGGDPSTLRDHLLRLGVFIETP